MKAQVVIFPGSNCDYDVYYTLQEIGIKVSFLWHEEKKINADLLVLPGGFSYGDYLRCGAIARFARILENINEFVEKGKLVLGICNGFQILTELKLLPGTLMLNKKCRFICSDCDLIVENNDTPFTNLFNEKEIVNFPIAHGEGNYYIDDATLIELKKYNGIVFKYKINPNGSKEDIAGIINKKGNVLGLMPHPERVSNKILGSDVGLKFFKSILNSYKI
ncbi:MAG: phosphoribosylformylglycinamidine synthase subunit PurQ [Spirochaetes bacterium]|nr:phosphoribosylformylglycinamidine synthase subunit PurQ [Spirochaetota bacterium]